ncbi:unnamed protein product, partial [Allacma fusca]
MNKVLYAVVLAILVQTNALPRHLKLGL